MQLATTNTVSRLGSFPYISLLLVTVVTVSSYYLLALQGDFTFSDEKEFLFYGYAFFFFFFVYLISRLNSFVIDPVVILSATLLVGVFLKVPYLVLNPNSMEEMLAGQDISIFIDGIPIVAFAIGLFLLGYCLSTIAIRQKQTTVQLTWRPKLLLMICLGITVVTSIAALLAIQQIGFASLAQNFSAKRFLDLGDSSSRIGTSLYLYFKIALLSKLNVYLCMAYILTTPSNRKLNKTFILLLLVSLLFSMLIPTIFSARAHAILAILDIAAIVYFSGIRIKWRFFLPLLLAGYGFFAYSSYIRFSEFNQAYHSAFETILSRRYLLDLTKTSHIFEYFKSSDTWLYGETLIGWMFIPVPSSIMPDKPLFVDVGQYLGRELYGYTINGVPPGYIGELFMNFGITGIILGMLTMGILIGLFWRWFVTKTYNPAILVLGSMITVRFGVFLFNNDLGTFVLKIILEAIPATFLVWLALRNFTKPVIRSRS